MIVVFSSLYRSDESRISARQTAIGTGQIKTGAPCRSERLAKYNQLRHGFKNLFHGRYVSGTGVGKGRRLTQRGKSL